MASYRAQKCTPTSDESLQAVLGPRLLFQHHLASPASLLTPGSPRSFPHSSLCQLLSSVRPPNIGFSSFTPQLYSVASSNRPPVVTIYSSRGPPCHSNPRVSVLFIAVIAMRMYLFSLADLPPFFTTVTQHSVGHISCSIYTRKE